MSDLRALRLAARVSQAAAGRLVGVTQFHVSAVERGLRPMDSSREAALRQTLERLARNRALEMVKRQTGERALRSRWEDQHAVGT